MQRDEPADVLPKWNRQEGQALITVIGAFALVLLLLTAALTLTQYSGKTVARQLSYQGQALNAAEAGLTDSLSWFRRQGTVVTVFNPQVDLTVNPNINDSEEPTLGIQRSFEMSDTFSLTGRYRVPRTAVADVSVLKGKSGAGTVWLLESKGCVIFGSYATSYGCETTTDVTPGRLIARETVRAEIQRLNLILPAGGAAIYARRGDGIRINTGSRVQGGSGIGVAYPAATGLPINGGVITGSTVQAVDADNPPKIGLQDIFGVTAQEVLSMADQNVASVADLPNPLPQMNLIVIRGSAVFSSAQPLVGSGILIVFGDLTIAPNSNASFSGVIYVTGNLTMTQPALISGAVIAAGNGIPGLGGTGGAVTLNSPGDVAEVDFDQSIVDQIQAQMGNYRFSRSMYIVGKEAK